MNSVAEFTQNNIFRFLSVPVHKRKKKKNYSVNIVIHLLFAKGG